MKRGLFLGFAEVIDCDCDALYRAGPNGPSVLKVFCRIGQRVLLHDSRATSAAGDSFHRPQNSARINVTIL
jgi:hypothetical protein